MNLEPGYYAVTDPDDPGVTTCWRRANGRGLRSWSGGAFHGTPTRLSRGNPPRPHTLAVRIVRLAWFKEVLAAIEADPAAARDLFSWVAGRCNVCSKKLTDPRSVSLGIGPECRKERAA